MKKLIALLMAILMPVAITSCAKPNPPDMEPKITQMRNICELAVMDCYYHNVAKFFDEDAGGILFWQKDKEFWIEYSGVIKLGVDASLVTLALEGDQVTITLPEAKVLDCTVDAESLSEASYIVAKKSAKVTADDEVKAFNDAQRQMEENAANDKSLLIGAQDRTKELLEGYVNNIGKTIGKEYSIRWIYLNAEGEPLQMEIQTEPEQPAEEVSQEPT